MVRRFGQPMEDNPIAELCGYGSVSGEGFVCETCWNMYPMSDAPYGCPVCNAPNAAMDAARARAEAMARPERGPYQVEWEKTEIEKTKRLLARRRP